MGPHRAGIARHRTVARPRHLRGEGGCTEARSRPLARLGYDRTAAGAAETRESASLGASVEAVSGYSSSALAEWPRLRVEPCVCHVVLHFRLKLVS